MAGKALEKTFGKSEIEVAQDKFAANYAKSVQGDDGQLIELMSGITVSYTHLPFWELFKSYQIQCIFLRLPE